MTPGVVKIGSLVSTSKRQHTYPGKRGCSESFERVSYLCRFLYRGRKVSYPFISSLRATALSKRGFTASANHCGYPLFNGQSGDPGTSSGGCKIALLVPFSGIAIALSNATAA